MKIVSCSVTPELAEDLARMAAKKGISRNKLMRGILEKYSIIHGSLAEEDFTDPGRKKGILERFFS